MSEQNQESSELPTSWIVEIRQRLAEPPPSRLVPTEEDQTAAVLVPVFVDAQALWLLLTKRSEELLHHRGQNAFPGGARETGEDAWQTALREAQEELALPPEAVLRLGELDQVWTPSGYQVTPCVGVIPAQFDPDPEPSEVAEVFQVPLTAFADPRMVEERPMKFDGEERMLRFYHVGNRQIWGLTAEIVGNLLERLGMATPPISTTS